MIGLATVSRASSNVSASSPSSSLLELLTGLTLRAGDASRSAGAVVDGSRCSRRVVSRLTCANAMSRRLEAEDELLLLLLVRRRSAAPPMKPLSSAAGVSRLDDLSSPVGAEAVDFVLGREKRVDSQFLILLVPDRGSSSVGDELLSARPEKLWLRSLVAAAACGVGLSAGSRRSRGAVAGGGWSSLAWRFLKSSANGFLRNFDLRLSSRWAAFSSSALALDSSTSAGEASAAGGASCGLPSTGEPATGGLGVTTAAV